MKTTTRRAVNFGSIYEKAMKSQLKQIGSNLSALRKIRNEEVSTVAGAVDLAPAFWNRSRMETVISTSRRFLLYAIIITPICNL